MPRVREFIRPGLKDFEIAAYAQYVGQQLGSEQGIFLCSSAPGARRRVSGRAPMQGRTLQRAMSIRCWSKTTARAAITRNCRAFSCWARPQELADAHAAVLEAQRFALSLLKPGASCREILRGTMLLERARSLPEERRLSMHGMGYDMVERPLIRDDEDMSIEEHMAIVCHPGILNERMFVHNTEIYLIEAQGASECLHQTPKEIFEIT